MQSARKYTDINQVVAAHDASVRSILFQEDSIELTLEMPSRGVLCITFEGVILSLFSSNNMQNIIDSILISPYSEDSLMEFCRKHFGSYESSSFNMFWRKKPPSDYISTCSVSITGGDFYIISESVEHNT